MPSTPVKEITDQIHEVPSSGSVSEDETTASTINGSGCNKHNNFDVQSTVSSSNSVIQHALIPAANAGSSTIQLQDAFEMILSKLKSKEFKPLMTDEHVTIPMIQATSDSTNMFAGPESQVSSKLR
jgi:hypothetical protein